MPTALITGGGDRIGKSIALFLAKKGYDIALHYNTSSKKADKVAQTIEDLGQRAITIPGNFQHASGYQTLINTVIDTFSTLDILINSASQYNRDTATTCTDADWDTHFNVNLKAPFFLTQAYALKQKSGLVINITDANTQKTKTEYFSYLLSKKALKHATEMFAEALAPKIRVNAIAPGWVLPPEIVPPDHSEKLTKKTPLQRQGTLQEIHQSILFIIENHYLTGQTLYIDGGMNLSH